MNIAFPNDTEDTIDSIRAAIGRNITFMTVTKIDCVVCELDPTTNTSMDSFCTTCSGLYWIPVYSGYHINAHVTWGNADQLNWVTGGQLFDGDCRVQVKLTDEIKTILGITEFVIVDEVSFEIKSKLYRGVPELNRVLIDLIERE